MTKGAVIIAASSFATSNVLGGHYRSAAAVADLLRNYYDVLLLNPGVTPSPVMQADGLETLFIKGSLVRTGAIRQRIAAIMRERSVRAVLAFDQKAGELLRPLARQMGVGFVLVKPGGGQPRLYYPQADHNIVFMTADKDWLQCRNPSTSQIGLAAGRIYKPEQDAEGQAALQIEVGLAEDDLAIVRIGRLHPHYADVNRASLALAHRLRSIGLPARLIMIGTPQDRNEQESLMALKGPQDAILCDERFTNQASRLLGLFRFNVGTGRGFMEGASMGQVMFCASQDPAHTLPLLVTEGNFRGFFDDNFSPRIRPDVIPKVNEARIERMVQDFAQQMALANAAKKWFTGHFSAATARQVYLDMIERSAASPESLTTDHLKSELHLRVSVLQDRLRKQLAR